MRRTLVFLWLSSLALASDWDGWSNPAPPPRPPPSTHRQQQNPYNTQPPQQQQQQQHDPYSTRQADQNSEYYGWPGAPPPPGDGGGGDDASYPSRPQAKQPETLESRYLSTLKGRAAARVSGAACCGAGGLVISKSITGSCKPFWAAVCATSALGVCALGGRGADFCLALGLTVNAAHEKSRSLRGTYPVFKQLKSAISLAPRRRFPPGVIDPWQYKNNVESVDGDPHPPPQFSMPVCLAVVTVLGGVGVSLVPLPPLVPSSLAAICCAGGGLYVATLQDARGDALRCIAARTAAHAQILLSCASQANLGAKTSAAVRLSALHLGAVDSKFGISTFVMGTVKKIIALASGNQPAEEQQGGNNNQQQQQQRRPQQQQQQQQQRRPQQQQQQQQHHQQQHPDVLAGEWDDAPPTNGYYQPPGGYYQGPPR